MLRRACFALAIVSLVSCHDGDDKGSVKDVEGDADVDSLSDTIFVPPDTNETDGTGAETDGTETDGTTTIEADGTTIDGDVEDPCSGLGEFGCSCVGNADCLNELCIEGPDGNFCTESCITECPTGYACLNTSVGGADPISICVPQHTRLCRPCSVQSDCQSPLDPSPAACVAGEDPSEGSFCATSCAVVPCPEGYSCEDVQVGEATAKMCRPVDDTCECRPAWSALGFQTSCTVTNEVGTCEGSRTCGEAGLTACSAKTPATCEITNAFGTCPGVIDCAADGCLGTAPAEEVCNNLDDDCDGQTDETGECCTRPEDCSAEFNVAATCDDTTTCQGTRRDARCVNAACVSSEPIPDDSACAVTTQALDCSPALPRFCTGALDQTAPSCDGGCASDAECLEGYHCDGTCVPDVTPGNTCDEDSDCGEGVCADGVCCNDACLGSCRACDVEGSAGVCSNVPAGADIDGECGGVACTGYYFGFEDKTCFLRAPVSADTAACDGEGACQDAADVCGAAAKGDVASSCHATCQVPRPGTCEGTTPGACDNITGGTQTCGVGACAVTVDACEGGAPKACVAGDAAPEVCDGIDNDCDGKTDGEDDNLVLDPCEKQAGVCAGAKHTAAMCVNGAWQACGDDTYQTHSANYQSGQETSCETSIVGVGLDNDCDGEVDEDFTYTSPAGTSIQGAAKPCGIGVCANGLTVCGLAGGLICSNDFKITLEVCDGQDNDCDGLLDSVDNNADPLQRVNCEDQDGVCAGAKKPNSLCAAGAWQPCNAGSYTAHNPAYEATETLCDALDNDCDLAVDESLQGPLNPVQLGVCSGTRQSCDGVNGWVDNYPSTYNQDEVPSESFLDENCDGIDGDVDLGLFVASNGSGLACTRDTPCMLGTALSLVSTARPHIYLREGTYGLTNITTANARLYGGYTASWARRTRTNADTRTQFEGGVLSNEHMTLRIAASGVVLDNIRIVGPNANTNSGLLGRSSYAVYATGANFTLQNSDVIAGSGAPGLSGGNGSSAAQSNGAIGGKGGDAYEATYDCNIDRSSPGDGGNNTCSGSIDPDGGRGGFSGRMDTPGGCGLFGQFCCFDATSGDPGSNASYWAVNSFGRGGAGGAGLSSCEEGGRGVDGYIGSGAQGGNGGSGGTLVSGFWYGTTGDAGTLGSHGGGGGGGGGSGGCDVGIDSRGAGGGGGGAGGCRAGVAGGGGGGGGGSFGIFAVNSTVNVVSSNFTRARGGRGGNGGSGGVGQPGAGGGAGGSGSGDSRKGGDGGNGGKGSDSGSGGGGAGGVSYCIYQSGGSLTESFVSYPTSTNDGGDGGARGSTGVLGGNGSAGAYGARYP